VRRLRRKVFEKRKRRGLLERAERRSGGVERKREGKEGIFKGTGLLVEESHIERRLSAGRCWTQRRMGAVVRNTVTVRRYQ
jgi:hypothetical protein